MRSRVSGGGNDCHRWLGGFGRGGEDGNRWEKLDVGAGGRSVVAGGRRSCDRRGKSGPIPGGGSVGCFFSRSGVSAVGEFPKSGRGTWKVSKNQAAARAEVSKNRARRMVSISR